MASWPEPVERVTAFLSKAGAEVRVEEFPEGTKTAQDAARAIGCHVAQIVKSLVFVADGQAFLALTAGSNRADTARLAAVLSADEVRRADAEEARGATGFGIGGTPPFGHPSPLRVVVDRDLLSHAEVWAAAGTPDAVFPLTPDALVRASGGDVADFAER